jgi:hypothetical protein
MSEADEEQLDFFLMANLRPATTGLPMVVWVSERGLARHDVRVEVSTVLGPRVQYANRRGAPGAAARRRPPVTCRFAGGRRMDPAEQGGAGSVLGLPNLLCPFDTALAAAVAARTAMNVRRGRADNRRNECDSPLPISGGNYLVPIGEIALAAKDPLKGGERSFTATRRNDGVAPKPVVPAPLLNTAW